MSGETPVTPSRYARTVTGPLGPPLEHEAIYPSILLEASRGGPFVAHVVQRAREEGWTVKQTRVYVAGLRALSETGQLADPRPASACRTCRRALPPAWDGRREARAYCSGACRQKAYRRRRGERTA